MRNFLQALTILLFGFSFVFANDFTEIREMSLKKDEQKKILVKYDGKERLFEFRWTLYKNGGLVVFRAYDKIVAQNVLYLREKNQSFRVVLRPMGTDFYETPYMLVRFKEFNSEKGEAMFELLLSDKKKQITLQDLKNG